MLSINELKCRFRKNDTFYFYANIIRYWRKKDFRDMVRGFCKSDVVLVQHPGKKKPDLFIYRAGAKNLGLFGEVLFTLGLLYYAEAFCLKPVVDWSNNCCYLEKRPLNGTTNAFEYYFKPVSEISYTDVEQYYNVVYSSWGQVEMILPTRSWDSWSYQNRQSLIGKFSILYKKYFVLNDRTRAYIDENLEIKLGGKQILGVHVRGTDFKRQYDNHPVCVTGEDYIKPAREIMNKYGYRQLFLATDSLEVLELFKQEFGPSLVYYDDVFRSDGDVGVHYMKDSRKNHHYLLGVEILRDAYTLAACDSFLAGLSNVSLAVQYIKLSEGEEFKEVEILDHGINHNNRRFGKSERGKHK